mgnify:CR=1 FL=1
MLNGFPSLRPVLTSSTIQLAPVQRSRDCVNGFARSKLAANLEALADRKIVGEAPLTAQLGNDLPIQLQLVVLTDRCKSVPSSAAS